MRGHFGLFFLTAVMWCLGKCLAIVMIVSMIVLETSSCKRQSKEVKRLLSKYTQGRRSSSEDQPKQETMPSRHCVALGISESVGQGTTIH